MPVLQSLSPVLFHGDTIFVVDHQGEPFAPVRPIIENLGIDWANQQQKLSHNKARWGVVLITTPSAGGAQKMLCIPVRKLAGFLATISPVRVREEVRPKVIQYQNECDDALWNYWTKGSAKRSESPVSQPRQPDLPGDDQKPKQLTENERDLLNTIKDLDASNRQLSNALETTCANYIKLLESHVTVLETQLKAQIRALPTEYAAIKAAMIRPDHYHVTHEEAETMSKMFGEGFFIHEIGRALGRPYQTVNKYLKGANV
ncbi:MAG TPA: phage antirepressor N-terminal domain-containing protein [Candidatus Rifleibacterium sp.]|nr:phage antirepressor N-terminal domain-containing protein [Candidatus Rifleibacterium sp.]